MKRPVENVVPSFSINWLQKLETRAKYSADIKTFAKQQKTAQNIERGCDCSVNTRQIKSINCIINH